MRLSSRGGLLLGKLRYQQYTYRGMHELGRNTMNDQIYIGTH